ncbi:hypothetical protein I350_03958 [Cryptococcus amylolentus CBS 6273]|uniref:Uncharacterized protein n=1 Tax=Cryptococcus amylolentus CBS 6273 TaxID=1296118 RepID=A0A1E3K0U6_9TREE|nr:hypothetical protein I350_03958 [Cryptococcus amylolentus CBS 6273]
MLSPEHKSPLSLVFLPVLPPLIASLAVYRATQQPYGQQYGGYPQQQGGYYPPAPQQSYQQPGPTPSLSLNRSTSNSNHRSLAVVVDAAPGMFSSVLFILGYLLANYYPLPLPATVYSLAGMLCCCCAEEMCCDMLC